MSYSNRLFLYGPVALLAALGLALSIYWYAASSAFAHRLDALNGRDVAPGVTLRFTAKEIGGYPFRVDAVLHKLSLQAKGTRGPVTYTAENFAMHSLDYGNPHWVFEAAGRQSLSWTGDDSRPRMIAFTPVLLRGSIVGQSHDAERLDIILYGANDPSFAARHAEFHMRRDKAHNLIELVTLAEHARYAPVQGQPAQLVFDSARVAGKLTSDHAKLPSGVLHLDATGIDAEVLSMGNDALFAALVAGEKGKHLEAAIGVKDGIIYLNSEAVGFATWPKSLPPTPPRL